MKKKQQMYIIWNDTDDITASGEEFTNKEADQFIKDFPKRYEKQGYYKDNNWNKLDPKDVLLRKEKVQ